MLIEKKKVHAKKQAKIKKDKENKQPKNTKKKVESESEEDAVSQEEMTLQKSKEAVIKARKNKHEEVKKPAVPIEEKKAIPDETPTEAVANWFKNIFNFCGKSSCCTSNNPYYDSKTWNDRYNCISY